MAQDGQTFTASEHRVIRLLWLAGLVYLLCELAFNAALIDAVKAQDPASLEYVGRVLAGFGLGLVLLRFRHPIAQLVSRVGVRPRPDHPSLIGGLLVAGIVLGYILQQTILTVAMGTVTQDQRSSAPDVLVLEKALITRVITLDGLNPAIRNDEPAYMSYIAMLGVTAWHRTDFMRSIDQQRDHLRRQLAESALLSKTDDQYAEYRSAIRKAREVHKKTLSKYKHTESKIAEKAGQYSGILKWFLDHRNACQSDACRDRYDSEYDKRVVKALGRHVPWQIFCRKTPGHDAYQNVDGRIQRIRVDGGYDCSGINPATVAARLRAAFARKHPAPAATLAGFLDSDAARAALHKAFPQLPQMTLQPNWSKADFVQHLQQALAKDPVTVPKINAEQRNEMARAVLVPPIAIAFSLTFTLLNLVGFLVDGLRKIIPARKSVLITGIAVVLIGFGLTAPSNGIIGGLGGFLIDWILHYESMIYPVGEALHFGL